MHAWYYNVCGVYFEYEWKYRSLLQSLPTDLIILSGFRKIQYPVDKSSYNTCSYLPWPDANIKIYLLI